VLWTPFDVNVKQNSCQMFLVIRGSTIIDFREVELLSVINSFVFFSGIVKSYTRVSYILS